MANPYFKFKQFTVYHNKCAMKVGTDGVLIGAWANPARAKRILDVGTGTGLIALMLAQRSDALINAIDIDKGAVEQAIENVERCKWNDRIDVQKSSFQEFVGSSNMKYDLIISNPPFYKNALLSPNEQRSKARHNATLPFEDLFVGVKKLMSETGVFALIFPADFSDDIDFLARKQSLFPVRKTWVKPLPTSEPKRLLVEYSVDRNIELVEDSLIIEMGKRHDYSPEYIELTKDFFLKM